MTGKIQKTIAGFQKEILSGDLTAVLTRFSDLILVACVGAMVGMMIVPLPTWLLWTFAHNQHHNRRHRADGIDIHFKRHETRLLPTILLITTLTGSLWIYPPPGCILLQADAGEVIRSFGMFVVGGNFVVGVVIFLIITLVQFIVITKGAERVAEVAARFTLDAMPVSR